jgi:hypothetical protein
MARANLASLLAESTDRPAVQEASPTPGVAGRTVEESGPRDAAVGRASLPPAGLRPDSDGGFDTGQQSSAPGPRYLQFERKELRIRVDQADELARLTRRINRARRGAGERITDNTLIRIAVDLLLEQSGRLAGTTEDELRKSLSL